MTAIYPGNSKPNSAGPAEPVEQIAAQAAELRSRLIGDDDLATDAVLAELQRIEHLAKAALGAKQTEGVDRMERDNLFEIIGKIRSSLDLDTIFQIAVTEVHRLISCERTIIYKFDQEYNGVVVAEALEPGWPVSLGVPLVDTCFRESKAQKYSNGRIFVADDIYEMGLTPCHVRLLERFAIRANLVVPILQSDRVWGLLLCQQCSGPRHWLDSEINALYQIGAQLSVAISQAEALKRTEQRTREERDQLLSFIARLRGSLELSEIFSTTVTEVQRLLGVDRAIVYRFDEDYNGVVVAEAITAGWTASLGVPIVDTCFQETQASQYTGNRIFVADDIYEAGLTPCHLKLLERFEVKANIVVPILQVDKVWGLLICHQCAAPRRWQESEINLLYQIATQLTVAVQQSELVQRIQRQARAEKEKLQLRDRLSAVISEFRRTLEVDTIFQTAMRESRLLLNADRVAIYRFDPDWGGEFFAESVAPGWRALVGTERARVNDTFLQQSQGGRYKDGESQVVNDVYNTGFDSCHIALLEQFQARAYIIVPFFKDQRLWGLLAAYQNSGPRQWSPDEVDVMTQIATQLTVSLQHAELVSQVQKQAAQQAEAATAQRAAKEKIQRRAMDLLIEVDPVSKGDLTVRARVTDDEIGTIADSYNQTVENLSRIVMQVQSAASQVSEIATVSGHSIQMLSDEAQHQSQEMADALAQLQKMALTTQAVSDSARQAELAVQQANRTVAEGDGAMNRTVEGILVIRDTVAATAKKIKRLSESSQKISKVVNLISNFAAQTNLLALNASIEAARAGEAGRGFAVVADEVRSLARQSASATAEIEKLVQEIQTETGEVAAAMEAGTEQVVKGTNLVTETRQSLTEIAAVAGQIQAMVESIATASKAQTGEAAATT